MQRMSPKALAAVALLAGVHNACAVAGETPPAWQVTPRVERSDVVVNGVDGRWDAWSVAVARDAGAGQRVSASVGRQDRNGLTDEELHLAASGRAAGWDATATVRHSPEAVFLPEWGYQVQVERAAGRHRRAGAGYQRMRFAASSVHLASAHVTFYRGDDEFAVEYRAGRNAVLDHDIRVLQLRAALLRGRNRFAAYLAHGDYLFDALGIPGGQGEGWSANVGYTRAVGPSTHLRVDLGAGGESDAFRQRTIAISVQYSP